MELRRIREDSHHPIRILLYGTEGTYLIEGGTTELLPFTFDASFLE